MNTYNNSANQPEDLTQNWHKPARVRHAQISEQLAQVLEGFPASAVHLANYLYRQLIGGRFEEIDLYNLPLGEKRSTPFRSGKKYARNTLRTALDCLVNRGLVTIVKDYGRGIFKLFITHLGEIRPFREDFKNLTENSKNLNFRQEIDKTGVSNPDSTVPSYRVNTEKAEQAAEKNEFALEKEFNQPMDESKYLVEVSEYLAESTESGEENLICNLDQLSGAESKVVSKVDESKYLVEPSEYLGLSIESGEENPICNLDQLSGAESKVVSKVDESKYLVEPSEYQARSASEVDEFNQVCNLGQYPDAESEVLENLEKNEICHALRDASVYNAQIRAVALNYTLAEVQSAISLLQERSKQPTSRPRDPFGWLTECLRHKYWLNGHRDERPSQSSGPQIKYYTAPPQPFQKEPASFDEILFVKQQMWKSAPILRDSIERWVNMTPGVELGDDGPVKIT